jgi:hypothetical protein
MAGALVLGTVAGRVEAQMPAGVVRDPQAARLEYGDLDRFSAAYPRLAAEGDTVRFLDAAYLSEASDGLRAYARMYQVDAEALAAAVRRHPERYAITAGAGPRIVREIEPDVRFAMARLQDLYPGAVFPPVFYLVGPYRAGGAVQRQGVMIGVEVYATPPADAAADRLGLLRHLVAHELVHYQQAAFNPELYQRSNTLLARAIKEGVADFLAELVSGGHTNPVAHAYGERHEAELWERFRGEMMETATGDWFFANPARTGEPRDLGYFVGYRIARSRFRREADPRAGVAALIQISDYRAFLDESGYAPGAEFDYITDYGPNHGLAMYGRVPAELELGIMVHPEMETGGVFFRRHPASNGGGGNFCVQTDFPTYVQLILAHEGMPPNPQSHTGVFLREFVVRARPAVEDIVFPNDALTSMNDMAEQRLTGIAAQADNTSDTEVDGHHKVPFPCNFKWR